jgi:D-glycerate 3-kinase
MADEVTAAEAVAAAVARWRAEVPAARPLVVGLCGPQGAGKSTIAAAVAASDLRVAVLSLDDLYLGPAARAKLAATVHPLLATRGVPGTHDVARGVAVLSGLCRGEPTALPRFDKATDAPRPVAEWPVAGPVDVVLFEGWCVGAVAQPDTALAEPVNALEADADPDATWRRFVNAQLAGPYRALFAPLDRLIVLRAPDFATVVGWRQEAERRSHGPMTPDQIARFCAHFERLTRAIDAEMPPRADLAVALAADRSVAAMAFAAPHG